MTVQWNPDIVLLDTFCCFLSIAKDLWPTEQTVQHPAEVESYSKRMQSYSQKKLRKSVYENPVAIFSTANFYLCCKNKNLLAIQLKTNFYLL